MASNEILERLDAHMARGNSLMAEVREEIRLTREFNERQAAETHELMRRHEVSFKHGLEVIEENREALQEVRVALRDQQAEIRGQTKQLQANTRWVEAQTKALLQLIDEIRGEPGAGPAPA